MKSKKVTIFLPAAPYALYEKQLKESMLTASGFIISLLVEKEKGSAPRNPVGRPASKKETQEEKEARWEREKNEPRTIPHPDQRIDITTGLPPPPMNRYELEIWSEQVDMFGPSEHKNLKGYMPKSERTG